MILIKPSVSEPETRQDNELQGRRC